jgi:NDP-sugar pyrophosphorylase family protein
MPNVSSAKIDRNGYVIAFEPQTEDEKISGALVVTGVYLLDTEIFKHPGVEIKNGEFGLPQTILAQNDIYPVIGLPTSEWTPINSIDELEAAERFFA